MIPQAGSSGNHKLMPAPAGGSADNTGMHTRRQFQQGAALAALLATAGFLPGRAHGFTRAAFEARSVADAARAFGGGQLVESRDVTLTAPEISDNGAAVPMALATTLPGVRHLLLLVEKNPNALVAKFDVNESVEPQFSVRAKMAQTSDVYAVALMADGRALFTRREVKVTLGGCG